jgi:HK97 family phage prohead protease
MQIREMEFRVTDAEKREVTGIAVPYEQMSNGEMFARDSVSLDPEAKLMWQHDKNEPIGKIVQGRHTDEGFEITATISNTQRGRDAIELLTDDVINRFSVGFIMRDSKMNDNRERIVTDAFVREVSLVSFPWYEGATVTEVRDDSESESPTSAPNKEETVENITPEASDLAEVREAIQHLEREVAGLNKVEAPASPEYRSAGDFLRALVAGEENAVRAYTGATTSDSVTTPIDFNLIRLVEAANPLGAVFGSGVTPATGMTITFAKVEGTTDGTGVQGDEGDDLGYSELQVTTDSVNIETVGNRIALSRQVIDRSTVDFLNESLQLQAIQLGAALGAKLRTAYTTVTAAQVVAENTVEIATNDYAGWVGALADAQALYFQPNGAPIDALVVSTNVFKGLLALDGNPVITFSGEANGFAGSGNPGALRGTLAGIPIVVDAGIDDEDSAFVSSIALRQFTSGALRLSQENAVNLTEAFSLSTYTAVADSFPNLIVPVVFAE